MSMPAETPADVISADGLVEMHGNARGCWFTLSRDGLAAGAGVLQSV